MKLSISLPAGDVEFLDRYARERGIESRSAVLHRAIRLLHAAELGDAYEDAWREWSARGEAAVWEAGTDDGLKGS